MLILIFLALAAAGAVIAWFITANLLFSLIVAIIIFMFYYTFRKKLNAKWETKFPPAGVRTLYDDGRPHISCRGERVLLLVEDYVINVGLPEVKDHFLSILEAECTKLRQEFPVFGIREDYVRDHDFRFVVSCATYTGGENGMKKRYYEWMKDRDAMLFSGTVDNEDVFTRNITVTEPGGGPEHSCLLQILFDNVLPTTPEEAEKPLPKLQEVNGMYGRIRTPDNRE